MAALFEGLRDRDGHVALAWSGLETGDGPGHRAVVFVERAGRGSG